MHNESKHQAQVSAAGPFIFSQQKQATGHFRELDATGWSSYLLLQYYCTKGLIAVQQAAPPKKKTELSR